MSTRFFLANPTLETSSINAIVRHKGLRYKKGIGVSIESKYWNPVSQKASVPKKYKHGAEVNHEIEKWKHAIDRMIYNTTLKDVDISDMKTFWSLVDCEMNHKEYSTVKKNQPYFIEYFEKEFLNRFLLSKSETRISRFKVIIQKLKNLEESTGKKYRFEDIGLEFYRDLQNYMNGLKHSANYFGTVIKIVKQVMKEANLIDKLHSNMEYTHTDFKGVSQDVDNIYLTEAELKKIYETQIDDSFIEMFYPRAYPAAAINIKQSYNIAKTRFLIGAYTGLRVSDFNKLTRDNIQGKYITDITNKTGDKIIVPVHPILRNIISSDFDFDLSLSDDKTRKYMKEICKFAKIKDTIQIRESISGKVVVNTYEKWQLVGTHTARRSFATNAYKAGVPTIAIMKITGHRMESTFMRYIRITQEENAEMLANHAFFGGGSVPAQK